MFGIITAQLELCRLFYFLRFHMIPELLVNKEATRSTHLAPQGVLKPHQVQGQLAMSGSVPAAFIKELLQVQDLSGDGRGRAVTSP